MRKRTSSQPYFYIGLTLLLLMTLPRGCTEMLRSAAIATLMPGCEVVLGVKELMTGPVAQATAGRFPSNKARKLALQEQNKQLELEKLRLQSELSSLLELNEERRKACLDALPARVVMRTASTWSSSLWIDVGEKNNKESGHKVVAINSPVVIGTSLVGIIDYVDNRQSRVCLITDPKLTPAVRAARGGLQNRRFIEHLDALLDYLKQSPQHSLEEDLQQLKNALLENKESWLLAKGELAGSKTPLWRGRSPTLKGTGFNYDFADEQGPARDLRTGQPLSGQGPALPLLKVGDLLVTTGMDGVFPPGLSVAEVTKIETLKEGAYYYDIEAKPTAGSFDELSLLFVIPPVK